MRRLAGSGAPGGDRLFAILDSAIRQLPHCLVKANKATLEEVVESDLLIHVVDVSHPEAEQQIRAVESALAEIGAGSKPVLTV